jgi:ribosome biogenesis GTPase A
MKKTREMIADNLKLVDFVIEVCDARIPESSRNPFVEEITKSKPRILCLNKCDIANEDISTLWLEYFREKEKKTVKYAIPTDGVLGGYGLGKLLQSMDKIPAKRSPARAMIVGVPNSGKSSIINRLAGRKATQTGDRPGVTRGKQWLTMQNGIQLLDTPGILWPKFDDPQTGLNLAFCGSIKDEIMDPAELGLALLRKLAKEYPEALRLRYGEKTIGAEQIEASESIDDDPYGEQTDAAVELMSRIAIARGAILPGKKIDYERTGRMLLQDFRSGKLGRISLERP